MLKRKSFSYNAVLKEVLSILKIPALIESVISFPCRAVKIVVLGTLVFSRKLAVFINEVTL